MKNNVPDLHTAIDAYFSDMNFQSTVQAKVEEKRREEPKVAKKVSLAFVMAMVLIFLAATALAVSIVSGIIFSDQHQIGTPISSTILEDQLYYLSYQGICLWSPEKTSEQNIFIGKEKLEAKGISTNARLFRNASELLLLDWDSQKIWAWENDDFSLKWDLAKSGLEKSYSGNPFIQNGSLWLYGSQTDETERAELVSVDLEAGTAQMCWPKDIAELVPYGEDKLLALQRDEQQRRDRLLVLSAKTGNAFAELDAAPILSIEGLTTDPETQTIYAVVKGQLSYWNGTEWRSVQPYTLQQHISFCAVMDDGYVTVGNNSIQYQPFEIHQEFPILTICGLPDVSDTDTLYQQYHPEMRIVRQKRADLHTKEVQDLLEAGTDIDLFHLYLDADTFQLMKNQSVAALSGSPQIMEDCSALLPSLLDAIRYEGVLYALPSGMVIPGYQLDGSTMVDEAKQMKAKVSVYLLNPSSPHQEMALDYLALRIQERSGEEIAFLKPEAAAPALHPEMQEWLKDIEADQRAMDAEAGIKTDEEALAARLKAVKEYPYVWQVTEEGLQDYRQNIAPQLKFY